jgi:hypothetical protein
MTDKRYLSILKIKTSPMASFPVEDEKYCNRLQNKIQ